MVLGEVRYSVATYPDPVQVWDVAAGKETTVAIGPAGQEVADSFRKVIETNRLEASFGRAVSLAVPLFDSPYHAQVYEGGVLLLHPDTGRSWWCWHPKRSVGGG